MALRPPPLPVLALLALLAALLLAAPACNVTYVGSPDEDGEAVDGEGGERKPDEVAPGVPSGVGDTLAGWLDDAMALLGADRPPTRALQRIRDVHDLRDWSYRVEVPDAVDRCRSAIADLMSADYEDRADTAMVVVVLSTMLHRDQSSLVRNDCVRALTWFHGWIHPEAATAAPAPAVSEERLLNALRALTDLMDGPMPPENASDRMVLVDAVSVLGSHDFDDATSADPALVRAAASRPRGVVRALAARPLRQARSDPLVAETLDTALTLVTDQVIRLSLKSALADPVDHVRSVAARSLEETGVPGSLPLLLTTLRGEEDAQVRNDLVRAIGVVARGDPGVARSVVPVLAGLLADVDVSVRRSAVRELRRLTGEDPGPEPSDWRRWWRDRGAEYADAAPAASGESSSR